MFQDTCLVFAFALFFYGVNAFYGATILAPVPGGSYTEGVVGQPIAINPLIAGTNDPDRDLMEISFSDLTELAERYTPDDTHRIWTVVLKENLHWSDGEPLTSDDIIFTLETIQNPDTHSPAFAGWQGVVAERLSEREVRFTLKTPYAFFSHNLASLKITPEHVFSTIPAANLRLSDYNLEPVGSGPYSFAGYEKRRDGFVTDYHFVASPYYSGEAPLIKELSFKFFPNYQEAINAFNQRHIDGLGGIAPQDVDAVRINHRVAELAIPRYYAVFINQTTSLQLREKEVRTALDTAIDRAEILTVALENRGLPVGGPLTPGIEGYDAEIGAGARFLPDATNAALDAAGWLLGDDGVRRKTIQGNELRLAFELVVPDIAFLVKTAEVLAERWKNVGIEITTTILSPTEVANDVVKTRNYQLLMFGNILNMNPDIFSFWHSSEKFRPGLNLSVYENKSVDTLLEAIRREFNVEKREEQIRELERLIDADKPAVFLFSPYYLYLAPKNLGGLENPQVSSPANRFQNVAEWYLKTARVFR